MFSKSDRLHVDIFQFFFTNIWGNILYIPLKMIGIFPEAFNFNSLFLKLNITTLNYPISVELRIGK